MCVFLFQNTHFIGNAHTIVEKKILKRRVFCMPAMVGHIRIVNIGSSGIFHIGDVFAIRPISYSRAFAGAGSLMLEIMFLSTIIKVQRLLMIQMSLIKR